MTLKQRVVTDVAIPAGEIHFMDDATGAVIGKIVILGDNLDVRLERFNELRKWLDVAPPGTSRYAVLYEALARAQCRREGIDPDQIIADGGHEAWSLVGFEAALKEAQHTRDADAAFAQRFVDALGK